MNEWEWRALEERAPVTSVPHEQGELKRGTRVRVQHARPGGDAIDLMFAGKTAVVESIEQDYEGGFHLALVFDDDPGRDLGLLRQPGHRFFYSPREVEICNVSPEQDSADLRQGDALAPAPTSVLVAGIGNIFLGDDAFGVEVVRRLATETWPPGVRVVDYGIRSLDLAYALMDGPDVTILVDACSRGEVPGTLFVIEPDLTDSDEQQTLDPHAANPLSVLRLAQSLGGRLKHVLLVGCEPETFGPAEGQLGLSDRVSRAAIDAADLVRRLVRDVQGRGPVEHDRPA